MFGGCPEAPENPKTDDDLKTFAETTILRFGKRRKQVLQYYLISYWYYNALLLIRVPVN